MGSSFKFLISLLSHDKHLGRILTGRISSGKIATGNELKILELKGKNLGTGKVRKILANRGVNRKEVSAAYAGDIVSIAGFENATVSNTLCDKSVTKPLQADEIDPPTLEVRISVNTSPFQGKEGNKVTSTQIGERLKLEAKSNVAIALKLSNDGVSYSLKGRGELQLGILFETMRREGYEFEIGPPKVLMRKNNEGVLTEPFERLTVEVDEKYSGIVIEHLGKLFITS